MSQWFTGFIAGVLIAAGAWVFWTKLYAAPAPWASNVEAQFLGAWRLAGSYQKMADGTETQIAKYKDGAGSIIYAPEGRMCAVLMGPKRPNWKAPQAPTNAELRDMHGSFSAYCGRYEIDEKSSTIIHHVDIDNVPNFIGIERKRRFEMHGIRVHMIVLDPPPPVGTVTRYLIWEKVGS